MNQTTIIQNDELDESDFDLWFKNPISVELIKIFEENKEVLIENILSLDPINDTSIDKKNAYLRGCLEMCEKILNLSFDQLFNKKEEEKSDEEKNQAIPYYW